MIRTFVCTRQQWFRSVCIHVECIPNTRGQEMTLVLQHQPTSSTSSTWNSYSDFFQIFFCHPRTPMRKISCVRWTNRHSQIRCCFPTELPQTVFATVSRHPGDHTDFAQEEDKSSMFDQDLGHVFRGRRIQISGHSDFLNFQ